MFGEVAVAVAAAVDRLGCLGIIVHVFGWHRRMPVFGLSRLGPRDVGSWRNRGGWSPYAECMDEGRERAGRLQQPALVSGRFVLASARSLSAIGAQIATSGAGTLDG